MVKFTEVIETSIEWTAAILFRPFKLKKWLILGFSAWMAGYLSGSSSNFGNTREEKKAEAKETSSISLLAPGAQQTQQVPFGTFRKTLRGIFNNIKNHPNMPAALIIIIILIVISVMLTIMWLNSRFSFVFLENVINNDASIKAPFRRHREIGNSLFRFSLGFFTVVLATLCLIIFACLATLWKLGAFKTPAAIGVGQIILACLPYAIVLILSIIAASVISLIIRDFMTIVMLKEKIKAIAAWRKTTAIFMANKIDFIKYIFIALGVGICSGIIAMLLFFACLFGLLLPVGIVGIIFYLIYQIIPIGLRLAYIILLCIVAAPLALFLFYCLNCLSLPFAVFFRTLSIKFFSRLEPGYNLFNRALLVTPPQAGFS